MIFQCRNKKNTQCQFVKSFVQIKKKNDLNKNMKTMFDKKLLKIFEFIIVDENKWFDLNVFLNTKFEVEKMIRIIQLVRHLVLQNVIVSNLILKCTNP